MSKAFKRAVLAVLSVVMVCSVALLSACKDDTPTPPAETFVIEGVVSSDIGPVSGVTVKLGSESKTTGTAGSYSFTVAAGEHTLTFEKGGFATVQKTVKTSDAVNGTVKLNVTMSVQEKEYFVVSGTVSDADGALAGVTVASDALTQSVVTDEQGAFTLPQLEKKGEYTFTFSLSGYVSASKTVSAAAVTGNAHTLDVTLEKIPEAEVATISGTVTADIPAGPLAGVTVKIGATEVRTDDNGAYSIQTSRDACEVQFIKTGYGTATESVTGDALADGAHTLDAALTRSVVLAGKTNTELLEEAARIEALDGHSYTADQIGNDWQRGGAQGYESGILTEGWQIDCHGGQSENDLYCYLYAGVTVSADNKALTFYGRTFGTAAEVAVQVIDVQTLDSALLVEKTSNQAWTEYNGDDYRKFEYDLSEYIGQKVILAIGLRNNRLTIESLYLTADGTFAFGRTPAADLEGLQAVTIASGTKYTATAAPKIQDTFVTVGRATVDNNRWMLVDARGGSAADVAPHSYVYAKARITAANARLSIRWSSYNNGTAALTKVLALDAESLEVIRLYSGNNDVSGEWIETGFDLTECVGKDVILAIGMSQGNRMGIDWIRFARMNYTVKGTVALPAGGYDLQKVSFKLDGNLLTTDEGLVFDTTTGAYSLTLDAKTVSGTLEVGYDNTGLADNAQLLAASLDIASLTVADEITRNFTLEQNSDAPLPIRVTLSIGDTAMPPEQAENFTVKLGEDTFVYASDTNVWTLEGLTKAEAVAKAGISVKIAEGMLANIYADVTARKIATDDYDATGADIAITIVEREILPGLTFSQMQTAKYLQSDFYMGKQAHRILSEFNRSPNLTCQEQNEGDTLQVQQNLSTTINANEYYGYIYGQKTFGENTSTLYFCIRRHNGEATFSVTVVDLEDGQTWVSDKKTTNSERYEYQSVTLPQWAVGKRVLVAIGVYNTDGHENQFVMEHIRFFNNLGDGNASLGKEAWADVVKGIAADQLQYADAQTKTAYTGKDTKNIFAEWGYAAKSFADGEAAIESVNEGFMMKTRQGNADRSDNRAFIYNKFAVTAGNSYFTMTARSFDTTVDMALTVYYEDASGAVVSKVMPLADFTKADADKTVIESREDSWIRFNCGGGYATFNWDLSEFADMEVVIVIGCRNLEGDSEHKLLIGDITLTAVPQQQPNE